MTVVSWIAAVLGLAIVLSTLMSVVTSLVLPRRGSSRIQNYAGRGMIKVFTRALTSIRDIRGPRPLSRAPGTRLPHRDPRRVAGGAAHRIRTDPLAVHAHRRPRACDHHQRILTVHPRIRGRVGSGTAPARVLRGGGRADDRRAADRVSAGPLRCVQPARNPGHDARQPRRVPGVGARNCSRAASSWTTSTASRSSISAGRSGPPTLRSRTPRTRCSSGSGPRTRTGRG